MNEKREIGIIGIAVMSSFLFFVAGYFLGKSFAIADYAFLIKESSFDEKIQGAFCSLPRSIGRMPKDKESSVSSDDDNADNDDDANENYNEKNNEIKIKKENIESELKEKKIDKKNTPLVKAILLPEKHNARHEACGYAQLAGFPSKNLATKYKNKLIQQGFPVRIVEHSTKTKKGKTTHWFQVVTNTMPMRKLQTIIKKIVQKDKLKSCKIIELKCKR